MERRHFIKTTSFSLAALLLQPVTTALANDEHYQVDMAFPDSVVALIDGNLITLNGNNGNWEHDNISVTIHKKKGMMSVEIQAPGVALSEVRLQWNTSINIKSLLLNDHWERTYGDVGWHQLNEGKAYPWYFMEYNNNTVSGFGVKTGCAAFCSWLLSSQNIKLVLDTRNGTNGVHLGNRTLLAAQIVTIKNKGNETIFQTARRFTRLMCDKAHLPKKPVYGINDWYFAYGNNSAALIMQHTELMAPMVNGLKNKAFSVVDDGWFVTGKNGSDLSKANEKFVDMKKLAAQIKETGMRPGLWTRPLASNSGAKDQLLMPGINGTGKRSVYDPSLDENINYIKSLFRTYRDWNYELVKFDYSSWDIFQYWGFEMIKKGSISNGKNWHMADTGRTNAEIVLKFYKAIREAAGNMYLIGCNTFSHLSAGLFELNRIGDDTSGEEWARTKKMGVNTLAFRGIQQGIFYAADGDCVGLTTKVPWEKNKQWMELLAKSGTPLFISAQPEAIGQVQKQTIKECFAYASESLPIGEPLDWMENITPSKWQLNGKLETFDWE